MNKLISMAELAKEFKINKSQLYYWWKQGIIKEKTTIGNMAIFDYDKTDKIINNRLKSMATKKITPEELKEAEKKRNKMYTQKQVAELEVMGQESLQALKTADFNKE